MGKFLVTGGAGFIGSHTVDRLLHEGHEVVAVDNFRTGRRDNLATALNSARFELIEADISDQVPVQEIFRRHTFDGVMHLAALVSVPESFEAPALNFRLNMQSVDLVARQCIEHRCPRLVFASSAAIYGDCAELPNRETALPAPMSPYAAAKIAGEYLLAGYAQSFALQIISLRYFNIYGPRQDPGSPYSGVLSIFSQRFAAGQAITIFGDGEQSRDFVSVHDVAAVNTRALVDASLSSGVCNVCTGKTITLNEIVGIFQQHFADSPAPGYQPARTGDIRHSCGDPQKLAAFLGMTANTVIQDGLHELITWYRQLASAHGNRA